MAMPSMNPAAGGANPYAGMGMANPYQAMGMAPQSMGMGSPYPAMGMAPQSMGMANPYQTMGMANPYQSMGMMNPYMGMMNPYMGMMPMMNEIPYPVVIPVQQRPAPVQVRSQRIDFGLGGILNRLVGGIFGRPVS